MFKSLLSLPIQRSRLFCQLNKTNVLPLLTSKHVIAHKQLIVRFLNNFPPEPIKPKKTSKSRVSSITSSNRKMVVHYTVDGYEAFCKFLNETEMNGKTFFFLFTGSKDPNGVSWCPDCVLAEPVIETVFKTAPEESHFVTVYVGDRTTWKNPACSFRKDPRTNLMVIPTLMKWKSPQRLEAEKLAKRELVEMLLEDD